MEELHNAMRHVGAQVAELAQQMQQMQQRMQQQMQQMQQMLHQVATEQLASGSGCGRRRHDGAALLAVLLEHPAVHGDQAVLCRLLASSRLAEQLAARHCSGRLEARVWLTGVEEADLATAWLRRHARLLRSLALRPYFGPGNGAAAAELNEAACAALAHGLRGAEQLAPGSLSQLRSFSCCGRYSPGVLLLAALAPASGSLTRLELSAYSISPLPSDAIARLTGLRHLELRAGAFEWERDNAGALAGLPHLTRLMSLEVMFLPLELRRLPSSLKHLELSIQQPTLDGAVDLRHLSRLTELGLWDDLPEDAVLPPSLVKLTIEGLTSLEPLLRLTALRRLQARAAPDQVVELSRRLPALDDICIRRRAISFTVLQAYAGAPVRGFGWLSLGPEPAAVLQHISRLTGLTALTLASEDGEEVAAGQLAVALGALPQLRELDLQSAEDIDWEVGGLDGGAAAAASAVGSSQAMLMRAVVGLPELRYFACWPDVSSDALAELSAAVGLTGLDFASDGGEVSGAALAPVLSALTRLERLLLPYGVVLSGDDGRLQWAPTNQLVHAMCGLQRLRVLVFNDTEDPATLRRLWVSLPELAELELRD